MKNESLEQAVADHRSGSLDRAEKIYREILGRDPGNPDALHLLGLIATQKKEFAEAIALIKQALNANPYSTLYLSSLGRALEESGNYKDAAAYYRKAIEFDPNQHEIHFRLGNVLGRMSDFESAARAFSAATKARPDYVEAYNNLGAALAALKKYDLAIIAFRSALQLKPDWAEGRHNLGLMLAESGDHEGALAAFEEAVRQKPGYVEALMDLGKGLMAQGELARARECYYAVLQSEPGHQGAHDNLCLCAAYDPSLSPREICAHHRESSESLYAHVKVAGTPANAADPEKRLRIGYVSPDLYRHPVGYFMEPVLANHDHAGFDAFCFHDSEYFDDMSGKFKLMAGGWHTIAKRSDDEVTALIQKQSIDILVDLTGRLANNRLPVFARKPAPVQISWIGYPATTGLTTMDYYLTDDLCDPSGHDGFYSEKLVRLPAGFCCYAPPSFAPPVAPLPAARNGHVTFGSFHNLVRLNQPVITLWSECMKSVPGSRLFIFRTGMTRQTQTRLADAFAAQGIAADRLSFRNQMPAGGTYLDVYAEIDIALDTFPWSGHTTACESLHMGVPVVTLAGDRHAGRMAASVLQRVHRGEWVAKTSEEYVRICRDLATDVDGLAATRAALRDQLAASPVCDGKSFTRALEEEFRKLWRTWCASRI